MGHSLPECLIKRSLGHLAYFSPCVLCNRYVSSKVLATQQYCRSPFARVRASIDVQYFTRGERGIAQKQSCIDDFFDLTEPAERLQTLEKVMGFRFMHGSIDHSRRYCVYTNALLRVFNSEGACHRIQAALQHDLNRGSYTGNRLVDQCR